jgi:hypothetical protein
VVGWPLARSPSVCHSERDSGALGHRFVAGEVAIFEDVDCLICWEDDVSLLELVDI